MEELNASLRSCGGLKLTEKKRRVGVPVNCVSICSATLRLQF